VINPFNARMSALLVPTGRGVYADADMVIILFDGEATARDGKRCRNTYTWYYQMSQHLHLVLSNEGRASRQAIAFFATREFDEFCNRVSPVH
jgi:uncharacterized protein